MSLDVHHDGVKAVVATLFRDGDVAEAWAAALGFVEPLCTSKKRRGVLLRWVAAHTQACVAGDGGWRRAVDVACEALAASTTSTARGVFEGLALVEGCGEDVTACAAARLEAALADLPPRAVLAFVKAFRVQAFPALDAVLVSLAAEEHVVAASLAVELHGSVAVWGGLLPPGGVEGVVTSLVERGVAPLLRLVFDGCSEADVASWTPGLAAKLRSRLKKMLVRPPPKQSQKATAPAPAPATAPLGGAGAEGDAMTAVDAVTAAMPSLWDKPATGNKATPQDQERCKRCFERSIAYLVHTANDIPLAVCYTGFNPDTRRMLMEELIRGQRFHAARLVADVLDITDYNLDELQHASELGLLASDLAPCWSVPLALPDTPVVDGGRPVEVVDTLAGLAGLRACFEAKAGLVGIDAEWRPRDHGTGLTYPVSTLQLASRDNVFIVDMLALCGLRASEGPDTVAMAVEASLGWLLSTPDVTKIGFQLVGDVQKLVESFPWWAASLSQVRPHVDAADLVEPSVRKGRSLSALANTVLGAPLNKAQQVSDWQQRPLSAAQLQYAALDACVLVALFDELAAELGAPLSAVLKPIVVDGPYPVPFAEEQYLPLMVGGPPGAADADLPDGHLGVPDVRRALEAAGLRPAVLRVGGCHSAQDAASNLGVGVGQVVKSLALVVGGEPVVVCAGGDDRVDLAKLGKCFGATRRAVRMATPEECLATWGYLPGSMPPVGHRTPSTLVISTALPPKGDLFCGAGSKDDMMCLTRDQLAGLPGGRLADVTSAAKPAMFTGPGGGTSDASLTRDSVAALLRAPKFLVDNMLGRLCRWLRVVGFDAEYVDSTDATAGDMDTVAAQAATEGRFFLSKDRRVVSTPLPAAVMYMYSNHTMTQFMALTEHLGMTVTRAELMSRCAKCNGKGYDKRTVEEARASGLVPDKVLGMVSMFYQCKRCAVMYWEGPKFDATRDRFEAIMVDDDTKK